MVRVGYCGVAAAFALRGDAVVEVVGEGEERRRPELDQIQAALVVVAVCDDHLEPQDGGDFSKAQWY